MTNFCPYCGADSRVPILSKGVKQRIFRYIWDHPNCSLNDIKAGVYGRGVTKLKTVRVHLSNLRTQLALTDYAIVSRHGSSAYRIVHRNPQCPQPLPASATPTATPSSTRR